MKLRLTDCSERDAALKSGAKFYSPPMACRNGHLSVRYTSSGSCVACTKEKGEELKGVAPTDSGGGIPTRVYVFSAGEFVKVGLAENVRARIQVTRTHCPMQVELAYQSGVMRRWLAKQVERECHDRLEAFSVTGEWFRIGVKEAVEIVKSVAGEYDPGDEPEQDPNEPAQAGFSFMGSG